MSKKLCIMYLSLFGGLAMIREGEALLSQCWKTKSRHIPEAAYLLLTCSRHNGILTANGGDILEGEWLTISEAANAINVTERTIRRQISEGRIKSKLEDGRRLVLVDAQMISSAKSQDSAVVEQLRSENGYLRQELSRRTSEIANLHEQLKNKDEHLSRKDEQAEQARQRQDTIILQLTRQLESSQQMLEYHRKSFWRRWFRKAES